MQLKKTDRIKNLVLFLTDLEKGLREARFVRTLKAGMRGPNVEQCGSGVEKSCDRERVGEEKKKKGKRGRGRRGRGGWGEEEGWDGEEGERRRAAGKKDEEPGQRDQGEITVPER